MAKYEQHEAGRGGWSRWVKPKRGGYKMMCCDCGLVHEMQFDYVRKRSGVFIIFRARRHERATSASRRFRKPTNPEAGTR